MKFTRRTRGLLCVAALLTIPSGGLAQDTAANNVTADATLANDTMANDLGAANDLSVAPLPADEVVANDIALANTVPAEDDNDFPWGLLGLLGLAGLMGRKKDHVQVDNRTDRRNV